VVRSTARRTRRANVYNWLRSIYRLPTGKDLAAGGTWLGVTRGQHFKFGVVTNIRSPSDFLKGRRWSLPVILHRGSCVTLTAATAAIATFARRRRHRSAAAVTIATAVAVAAALVAVLLPKPKSVCSTATAPATPLLSRGQLVMDYLKGDLGAATYAEKVTVVSHKHLPNVSSLL
jgi:uncharacterized protein with NRDE domain